MRDHEVGGRASSVRTGPVCPALVGREEELATLAAMVAAPPSFAVVEGEAGIGKTRLVDEVLRRVDDRVTVLVGHCQPFRDPFPLGPVVEAVESLGDAIARLRLSPLTGTLALLLPELAAHLPQSPPGVGDPALERHRRFRALRELLGAVGSCVLVLEDLHWADDTTVEWLAFLLARPPEGLAVVGTWRREDLGDSSPLPGLLARPAAGVPTAKVVVPPLGSDEVRAFLEAALDGQEVSPEFTEYLRERSGGVPFSIEEMLRLLQDRDDVRRKDGRWVRRSLEALEVPPAIRDTVGERLARLSPQARHAAEAVAVLRAPADITLLAAVLDEAVGSAAAAVAGLDRTRLIEANGTITFRHALARDAVYESLTPTSRTLLHVCAAEALAAQPDPPAAEIAYHWSAAGCHDQWLHHAEQAAEQALAAGAYSTVVRLLHEPLAAGRADGEVEQRLAVMLAEAALHCRAHAVVIDTLRAAVARHPHCGSLRVTFAAVLFQNGDVTAGREEARRAVPLLADDPQRRTMALRYLALPQGIDEHADDHVRWADEAVAVAHMAGVEATLRSARVSRVFLHVSLGRPSAWSDFDALWGEDWDDFPLERLRLATNVAFGAYLDGSYGRCADLLRDARTGCETLDYGRFVPVLAGTTALLDWATGRWDGHDGALTESAAGSPSASAELKFVHGALLLARGEVRDAEAVLTEVAEQASAAGETEALLAAQGQVVRVLLGRNDATAAAGLARQSISIVRGKRTWLWGAVMMPWAVAALVADGQLSEAAACVEELEDGLAGCAAPIAPAALAHCRGVVAQGRGDAAVAASLLAAAEEAWAALPHPFHAALAREERGACVADADVEEGGRLLRSAADAFDDLGASWDAARVWRRLRDHGLAPAHRRGRKGYGSALSPREAEVARLAGEGLTNRQIAEALFLSPRTVERHMSQVFRKLDVASREELSTQNVEPAGA